MKKRTLSLILFSLLYLFLCSTSFAQNQDDKNKKEKIQQKENSKEEKTKKQKPKDVVSEYLKKQQKTQGGNRTQARPIDEIASGASFWGPFIFLLLMVAILYIILKFIRRKKSPSISDSDLMLSLGTLSLSNGALIEIVEIGNKIYVLGVSSQSVNLLMKIEDQDLILKLKSQPLSPKHKTFLDVLGSVFDKKGPKNIQIDEKSESGFLSFLKEQKDRLNKLK